MSSSPPPSGSPASPDLRTLLPTELKRHRRLEAQGLFGDAEALSKLAASLPPVVPFGAQKHRSALWFLDWDHRLPSRHMTLRLYAFYSDEKRAEAERSIATREHDMDAEDRFPEFDLPDYSHLPADEAYEAELDMKGEAKGPDPRAPGSTITGGPPRLRLVSEFRRQVTPSKGQKAVEIVRTSASFGALKSTMKNRPAALGDLEPAEWVPPCESGQPRWGLDVWYLLTFNGMLGEGRAFLVDLENGAIFSERDFQFRVGPG